MMELMEAVFWTVVCSPALIGLAILWIEHRAGANDPSGKAN